MSGTPTSPPAIEAASRLGRVDAVRILAALCVVYLHAKPFVSASYTGTAYSVLRDGIILFTRFAVPFFFIAAGFFLSRKLVAAERPLDAVSPYIRRLAILYLAWSAFYFFFPINWLSLLLAGEWKPFYWKATHAVTHLMSNPLVFLFKSTSIHLWFLPALAIASYGLALAVRYGKEWLFLSLGFCLYLSGALSDAYGKAGWGLQIDPLLVLGLCYGPLLVGLGWVIARHARHSFTHAALLIVSGFSLQYLEASWLLHVHDVPLISPAYLVGTLLFGTGMMTLGLALPAPLTGRMLRHFASLTLGIYLIHIWVKGLLLPLDGVLGGPLWELGFPVMIFMASWMLVLGIRRTPFGGKLL